jgi:hypothetical protein
VRARSAFAFASLPCKGTFLTSTLAHRRPHATDDFVRFFTRCKAGLKRDGLIVARPAAFAQTCALM